MLHLRAPSLADTHAIAASIATVSRSGDIIVLAGGMGAGKTAFAQGFGRSLGVDDPITSPTFTLVHSYDLPTAVRGVRTLHHADLYRLDRMAEVADLALFELAEFGGIVLVEWGDVIEHALHDHLLVHLAADVDDVASPDPDEAAADPAVEVPVDVAVEVAVDGPRLVEVAGTGPTWAARWERLESLVEEFRC